MYCILQEINATQDKKLGILTKRYLRRGEGDVQVSGTVMIPKHDTQYSRNNMHIDDKQQNYVQIMNLYSQTQTRGSHW